MDDYIPSTENEFYCPYCNEKYDDCIHEFFDSSDVAYICCGNCNKEFFIEQEFTAHYQVTKLPCALGNPHEFQHDKYRDWKEKEYWKCKWCDKNEWRNKDGS
jgi:hypothetical protein